MRKKDPFSSSGLGAKCLSAPLLDNQDRALRRKLKYMGKF